MEFRRCAAHRLPVLRRVIAVVIVAAVRLYHLACEGFVEMEAEVISRYELPSVRAPLQPELQLAAQVRQLHWPHRTAMALVQEAAEKT